MDRRRTIAAIAAMAGMAAWGPAIAQAGAAGAAADWPAKPVRIIVAFPPGAPGDLAARTLAEKLTQAWKQPVVVENRPGASGNIGMEAVARAAPDGYTLVVGPDTMYTVNPLVYRKLGFSPERDLVPVTYLAAFTQTLVCHPSVPARTVPELARLAKAQPMNYASGGAGVPGHLAFEMLQAAAGFQMTHVPYKGPSPAVQDVLAGQVPCGFLATPVVWPLVKAGRLNAIAVSSAARSPLAREVPTVAEGGIAGFDATFAETLSAPRGTPPALLARIQADVAAALALPDVRDKLVAADLAPLGITPEAAAQRHEQGRRQWGEVVRRIHLQLD